MAEETLLTAARRVLRFVRIDEAHGGLLSLDTLQALETLDKQIRRAAPASANQDISDEQ